MRIYKEISTVTSYLSTIATHWNAFKISSPPTYYHFLLSVLAIIPGINGIIKHFTKIDQPTERQQQTTAVAISAIPSSDPHHQIQQDKDKKEREERDAVLKAQHEALKAAVAVKTDGAVATETDTTVVTTANGVTTQTPVVAAPATTTTLESTTHASTPPAPSTPSVAQRVRILHNMDGDQLAQRLIQQGGRIAKWVEAHHKTGFYSHGIWETKSAASVIQQRRLSPAEAVLRDKNEVEYEVNLFGNRSIRSLPTLTFEEKAKIKELESKTKLELQRRGESYELKWNPWDATVGLSHFKQELAQKYKCTHEVITIAYDQSLPKEQRLDSVFAKKFHEAMKANLEMYHKTLFDKLKANFDETQADEEIRRKNARIERVKNRSAKSIEEARNKGKTDQVSSLENSCSEQIRKIEEEVNQKLQSEEFKKKSQKGKDEYESKMKELRENLPPLPEEIFNATLDSFTMMYRAYKGGGDISNVIRVYENRFSWSYGKAALVLIGKDSKKNITSRIASGRVEVYLRSPFENEGEFFTISLDEPETLMLVPRAVLDASRKEGVSWTDNIIAIEDLALEALAYFQVPEEFMPKSLASSGET